VATLAALVGVLTATTTIGIGQERESPRPDLAGRWRLNRELSENAEAKLEGMRSQSSGGHGFGRHGGSGGSSGGAQQGQMEEARSLLLDAPQSFVLTLNGERIVLTESTGRVRTLVASGRKEKIDGRDVRTKWDNGRLVTETSLASAKVTDTYERLGNPPQLIVTTKMEMHGRELSVRRVYDAERGQ